MLNKIILSFEQEPKSAILALPGRGQSGFEIARLYQEIIVGPVIVGLTPENYQWYPMPNGPEDQEAALSGIEKSADDIEEVLYDLEKEFGVTRECVSLVGYSAGAVMAIQMAIKRDGVFASVVSHCGVILDPESIPKCKKPELPFLFFHNEDDTVFSFNNRYLPTKAAMQYKKYKFNSVEREVGGHKIRKKDVVHAYNFMARSHNFSTEWGGEFKKKSINKADELQRMAENPERTDKEGSGFG